MFLLLVHSLRSHGRHTMITLLPTAKVLGRNLTSSSFPACIALNNDSHSFKIDFQHQVHCEANQGLQVEPLYSESGEGRPRLSSSGIQG